MDFEDGLKVVQERGAAMQDAADRTPSGMVSILGLDRPAVEALCAQAAQGELLQVANLLCAGEHRRLRHESRLRARGRNGAGRRGDAGDSAGRGRRVSHVDHAAGGRAADGRVGRRADCSKPRIPVVSNVDAQAHDDPQEIRSLLVSKWSAPYCGKIRSGLYLQSAATSFMKWGRAACSAAC